jgi:hypothetical protein
MGAWNATPERTDTLKSYVYNRPIIIKQKWKDVEDSVENGTDYEHSRARDCLMQEDRSKSNSSITRKMNASTHSCKEVHEQNQ